MTTLSRTTLSPAPRPIGFIDPDRARAREASQTQAAIQSAQPRPLAQTPRPEAPDTLLRFDGGERVSFLDGSHNLMVLGTTGSGKTASVLLPAFDKLCAAGFGGIAVDSKGSLAPLLRAIARQHGREADIVEIGPYAGAMRINLLTGRDRAEAASVLKPLLLGYCAHDTDRFWRMTGFEQLMDAYEIAAARCRRAGVPLGLHVPARMLADSGFALGCFEKFKNSAASPAERELAARIADTGAHIVPCSGKKMEERIWKEQVTYYAFTLRTGMSMLRAAPGILPNFFAADGEPLDIGGMAFDQRRIVVLRLSPDSGETGAGLARLLLRQFYSSVFARGKALPAGNYVFALADELQDYVSTDPIDALNDSAFLAKCREFKCIFLGGTQSAIALSQRASGGLADVRAMLNNANVRIYFYSDDPETQRLAGVAAEDVLLHELEPSQCLLAHYDASTRRHESGVTSTGTMYEALRPILESTVQAEDRTAVPVPDEAARERRMQNRIIGKSGIEPEAQSDPPTISDCLRSARTSAAHARAGSVLQGASVHPDAGAEPVQAKAADAGTTNGGWEDSGLVEVAPQEEAAPWIDMARRAGWRTSIKKSFRICGECPEAFLDSPDFAFYAGVTAGRLTQIDRTPWHPGHAELACMSRRLQDAFFARIERFTTLDAANAIRTCAFLPPAAVYPLFSDSVWPERLRGLRPFAIGWFLGQALEGEDGAAQILSMPGARDEIRDMLASHRLPGGPSLLDAAWPEHFLSKE